MLTMYLSLLNRLMATLVLCSLCLPGCRSGAQVPLEDVVLEKSGETSDDELASLGEQLTRSLAAFGSKEWRRYFGEVGSVPPLPEDIVDILNSACPFWEGKVVKDTHLLVLIPAAVDGEPFSLNLLGNLIRNPKGGGHSTSYCYYNADVERQLGAQSPVGSYWVLMTREVLEGSRDKGYESQKELVAQYASRKSLPYELPGVLEAATAILSHYVRSGERLYADSPSEYTRCQWWVVGEGGDGCKYPAAVGGFSPGGVCIYDCGSGAHGDSRDGVSGLRKLSSTWPLQP
ncbi:MAG: hypothetical protein MUC61_00955 [Amoebophilaceae bacterium]|nr:hypothetical protein [Amoebophilaceae bacterium]